MLSSEWSRQDKRLELEPMSFRLVCHVYPAGSSLVPAGLADSFSLIVSGALTCSVPSVRLSEGDLLERQRLYTVQTPLHLWQVSGAEALLLRLRQLATQLLRKDRLTAAHAARVGRLAREMGQALDLCAEALGALSLAAYLHDIGKLSLPSQLLYSPKKLSLSQWRLMTEHPLTGSRLLGDTPLAPLGPTIEQHHERLDGSGYPHGLKGEALSVEASIIAVADTFDAITHPRPYQNPRSVQQALSEINRYSDVLYPGEVVEALNRVVKVA